MDGKLMAGETPKKKYPQPLSDEYGRVYRGLDEQLGVSSRPFFLGPLDNGAMGRSPRPNYLYAPDAPVTPRANPAAVRAYTRNAPYMEEFMSDPQTIVSEMYRLQKDLKENPNDPVSEYRFRILRQALGDVFGMQAPEELDALGVNRPSAQATPSTTYGGAVTPKYRY